MSPIPQLWPQSPQTLLDSLLATLATSLTSAAAEDDAPLSFADFIRQVNPRYKFYRHCDELIAVLQQVADDTVHRVMVFLPPRHSKSETVSRLFPAYYLYRHPDRFVGMTSYAADLAYTLSRAARGHYKRAGGVTKGDADAVQQWETTSGGGLWAAGVGGPITGKGFHLGIIDDPLKNAEDAGSDAIRRKQEDWYGSTFYTRGEPGNAMIVVQTRWNEADLSGYLLSMEGDEPEGWYVVSLPAIAEAEPPTLPPSCTRHPDWRVPGEALCPERYDERKLRSIEVRLGAYFWAALYQQRPRPAEGNLFKRGKEIYVDATPAQARRVRRWDIASTKHGGDYTVGVLMSYRAPGIYCVEDVVRGQWSSDERNAIMRSTAESDRARGSVLHVVPQDPGAAGVDVANAFIRLLAGFRVEAERESGDKALRADPFAAQWNAGNVEIVRAAWNAAYISELTAFPYGKLDDQVDASSGAFNKLANQPKPTSGAGVLAQGAVRGW